MALRKYRDLIETFEFGSQFSIFSGFRLVLASMDENETLQQLIGELRSSKTWRKALLNVVKAILRCERNDSQMAFDGCIAAYLYCLWKADLRTAYAASKEILNTSDLWWSAKLALHVRSEYLAEQISKSVQSSSETGEPIPYTLTELKAAETQSNFHFSLFSEAVQYTPSLLRRYAHGRGSKFNVKHVLASFDSPSPQLTSQGESNPVQHVEIAVAS